MSHYTVPVVLVDDEGQEHRFSAMKAAAAFLGTTNPSNVTKAALCGYKCHGYRVYREDEYDLMKGKEV